MSNGIEGAPELLGMIFQTDHAGQKKAVASLGMSGIRPILDNQLKPGQMLYKYLAQRSFMRAWIEGGDIPINTASVYRSDQREGIYTPDEVAQRQYFGVTPASLSTFVNLGGGTVVMVDCIADGQPINGAACRVDEDVYVDCFGLEYRRATMRQMRKKACVRIVDPQRLKAVFDEQMGTASEWGSIVYTTGPERSHFQKSVEDNWQREFRMIWRTAYAGEKWVTLPAGIAEPISPYP